MTESPAEWHPSREADARALVALDWVRFRMDSYGGIPLMYDNAVAALANAAVSCGDAGRKDQFVDRLDRLMRHCLDAGERFQPLRRRLRRVGPRRDVSFEGYACGQGVQGPLRWRELNLFKNVWDLAIYQQLLLEVRPRSIIELGSGTGAGALWLRDMSSVLPERPQILSFDVQVPALGDVGVRFTHADCSDPELRSLRDAIGDRLPRPWLVIEDVHVNTLSLLAFFDGVLSRGDYLVVEDSSAKQADLDTFARTATGDYAVDCKYADMFGVNVTSAMNSLLVRR
ncbi:CmcI family methyltransferase [Streptosporangium roseum]|uniref:CmcI family methyltransferase n=1 Tax=Streptosporangium roseum TaxID=2001 RepID=UPI0004CCA0B6|nr:CmcI family methyltransferase [Streptosporangium roseum]